MKSIDKANKWLSNKFDTKTRNKVQRLIEKGGTELEDAFYKNLEFGTGGMRGIMGVGTNRMNQYTIGIATQGFANYLKKHFKNQNISVAIAYDCRNNSQDFAKIVANVFSANSIKVYLFDSLRPTPELSFAIRHLKCKGGIVITASHNPVEYNGYKVYWKDGAQITPPQDNLIINEISNISIDDIKFTPNENLIEFIGKEIDDIFIQESLKQSITNQGKDNLKIVYTPIHGTSITLIPKILKQAEFQDITIVEEQAIPNGNFPTVKSPNPEEPEALSMAIKKANEINADIVIGTDPDGDRIGIAVRDLKGNMKLLNGNQTATILQWFVLKNKKENNLIHKNNFVVQTIVTSDFLGIIAKSFSVKSYSTLTGFKWIAKIIKEKEGQEKFLCGGEESFGFMIGDFVRDKDSITATLVACEIAAYAKANNSSIYEELIKLYCHHGHYQERLISLIKKGKSGAKQIQSMMAQFRNNLPKKICESAVIKTIDLLSSEEKDLITNNTKTVILPKSNVFQIILEDGTKITARPSGTEPKIKFYISVNNTLKNKEYFEENTLKLESKIDTIIDELKIK